MEILSLNKKKLRALFIENGENDGTMATYLGIAPQTFSLKINEKNESAFTYPELCKLIERYKMNREMIVEIFFDDLVS